MSNNSDVLIETEQFMKLYQEIIKERANKNVRHDINLYYDESCCQLIINIKDKDKVVYSNYIACSKHHAKLLANCICRDFIENHRVTLSSISEKQNNSTLKLQNSFFDLYYQFDDSDTELVENIHLIAIDKMNTYNANLTLFEKQVQQVNKRTNEVFLDIKNFINLYDLVLNNFLLKDNYYNISVYYDRVSASLILNISSNGNLVYSNQLKCPEVFGQMIAIQICENFIKDHEISLPSRASDYSSLTLKNTTCALVYSGNSCKKQINSIIEKANQKMQSTCGRQITLNKADL